MPSFLASVVPTWGQAERTGLPRGGGQLLGLSGNHMTKRRPPPPLLRQTCLPQNLQLLALPEPLEANCSTLNLYRSLAKSPGEDATVRATG